MLIDNIPPSTWKAWQRHFLEMKTEFSIDTFKKKMPGAFGGFEDPK